MIKIIAGGKKNVGAFSDIISEYEKRLRKPFDVEWEFCDEEKLARKMADWPFSGRDFVICCDERGQNISSPEFSQRLEKAFVGGQNVMILIGGAYGFDESVRERADFVWSFGTEAPDEKREGVIFLFRLRKNILCAIMPPVSYYVP